MPVDLLDDARALVAEDAGQLERDPADLHTQVGVAQARRGDPDQHLAGTRSSRLTSLTVNGAPSASTTAAFVVNIAFLLL